MAENSIDILVKLINQFSGEAKKIIADTKAIGTSSAGAVKGVKDLNTASEGMSKTVKGLAAAGAFAVIAKGLFSLGSAAIKAAADWESMQASFTTLLGSADKANKLLNDIKKTAETTPFTLTNLTEASKTLLAFGIAQEKIIPTMRMLGDVSGGNSEKLKSLTLAYAQVQSTGRLMGQDLLQMINQGFNPLQVIAKKTGKTMGQLKKEMEKGSISAAMVADAFKTATSAGGTFFNSMNDQSKVFWGRLSNLQDAWDSFLRSLGGLLLPVAKIVVDVLIKIVEGFNKLPGPLKNVLMIFAAVAAATVAMMVGFVAVAAIGPVVAAGFTLMAAAATALGVSMTVAFVGIPLLIGAIAAGVYLLVSNFNYLAGVIKNVFAVASIIISEFLMFYMDMIRKLIGIINKIPGIEIDTSAIDKAIKKVDEFQAKQEEGIKKRDEQRKAEVDKKKQQDAEDLENEKLKQELMREEEAKAATIVSEEDAKKAEDRKKQQQQELGMLGYFLMQKGILTKKEAEGFAKWQNFMASATTSKNKEVAAVAKAMAIYNIGLQTYEAAMGAFNAGVKFGGPLGIPLGIAMAATATAFGVEQANAVASQQPSFATGGVVGGFNGATTGGDNTQANVREGEMLLNAGQQKKLFDVANGGGGGGSQTIQLVVDNMVLAETVVQGYNKGQNIGRVSKLQ